MLILTLAGRAHAQGTLTAHAIPTLTPEQQEILSHMSIAFLPDGQGGMVKTLRISDINVQIVNGLDATNGFPADPDSIDPGLTATNGLGNLIVGYNELGNPDGDDRTGSHNIVVGHGNSFSTFGGFVGALNNTVSGAFSSVSGGSENQASGPYSSVSGGHNSTAGGFGSSIGGGMSGSASGAYSSISGGRSGLASGNYASVSGGWFNQATGLFASVSGGYGNRASREAASVSGGRYNVASGTYSSISGGLYRSVAGIGDWRAGTLFEDF